MSKCKSCGAEIIWIKTKSGKAMVIDMEYTPEELKLNLEGKP